MRSCAIYSFAPPLFKYSPNGQDRQTDNRPRFGWAQIGIGDLKKKNKLRQHRWEVCLTGKVINANSNDSSVIKPMFIPGQVQHSSDLLTV